MKNQKSGTVLLSGKTSETKPPPRSTVYEFSAIDLKGQLIKFDKYKGMLLLIVNIATKSSLTMLNLNELKQLDEKYGDQGFKILAFPCNQFCCEEPGNEEDILCYIEIKDIKFDVFSKVDVNGNNAHPLWKYLVSDRGVDTKSIKWNFTKFLINHNGYPVERYGPLISPIKLCVIIEQYIEYKDGDKPKESQLEKKTQDASTRTDQE